MQLLYLWCYHSVLERISYNRILHTQINLMIVYIVDSKDNLLDYTQYNDVTDVIEINEQVAHVKTIKRYDSSHFEELVNVSTESEQIEVVSDSYYNISDSIMEISIDFVDENEVIENIDIIVNVTIEEDGQVLGDFIYDGVIYNVQDVIGLNNNNLIIETFAISTSVIVGLIAGAIIGGVTGAVISYNKYHTIKWRYVVGGTVIGAIFGQEAT